jgi:hypothetical protein
MSEMTERPCRACSGTGYRGLDDCSDCGCTGTITVVPARPLADPTETLALIAEHYLSLDWTSTGQWRAAEAFDPSRKRAIGFGPTMADAVRECVSRIRGQQ